jgi:hypothetical protein
MHSIGCFGTTSTGRFHGTVGSRLESADLPGLATILAIGFSSKDLTLRFMKRVAATQHGLAFQAVSLVVQPLRHTFVATLVTFHPDSIICSRGYYFDHLRYFCHGIGMDRCFRSEEQRNL